MPKGKGGAPHRQGREEKKTTKEGRRKKRREAGAFFWGPGKAHGKGETKSSKGKEGNQKDNPL